LRSINLRCSPFQCLFFEILPTFWHRFPSMTCPFPPVFLFPPFLFPLSVTWFDLFRLPSPPLEARFLFFRSHPPPSLASSGRRAFPISRRGSRPLEPPRCHLFQIPGSKTLPPRPLFLPEFSFPRSMQSLSHFVTHRILVFFSPTLLTRPEIFAPPPPL